VGEEDWNAEMNEEMRRTVLPYLYIYVALTLAPSVAFGQNSQQKRGQNPQPPVAGQTSSPDDPGAAGIEDQAGRSPETARPGKQMSTPQTPAASPELYRSRQPIKRTPASQYSPLAAQGGYWRDERSPGQIVVDYFNPRHLNLGQIWEERRQAWLYNVAYNQYFWYAYCVTGLLILSWFVLWWVWDDKVRSLDDLAENTADALRYCEFSKREAKASIRRYNEHVDKCNRVIEDQRSGLMTTPETANLGSLKQELEKLKADNVALSAEKTRLTDQLTEKTREFQQLAERITYAEKQIQKSAAVHNDAPNAQLVERINRLEKENWQLKQPKKPAANGDPLAQTPLSEV
jgi:regulator of replication initiation timing